MLKNDRSERITEARLISNALDIYAEAVGSGGPIILADVALRRGKLAGCLLSNFTF